MVSVVAAKNTSSSFSTDIVCNPIARVSEDDLEGQELAELMDWAKIKKAGARLKLQFSTI